ncbi:MAG TPA: DUF3644 domain-containing protein [Acidimicrobiales bacterium]|nr:DUF3644 domain-containing protein [Acidimicrobiales bacterium]
MPAAANRLASLIQSENMVLMKLRREAGALKKKALASLRRAVRIFNEFDDDGRASAVLLHLQHSFEMLLKAGLVQRGQRVVDPRDGRAIGFEKCVNLGRQHLALTEEEAGTLRAIDALRDDEQHWMTTVSEGILYLHCRAATTLFDDLLRQVFDDSLIKHLPRRVLPISSEPPRDIQLLLDEDYHQINQLLRPGNRKRSDAHARIRGLLAIEAHVREDGIVSKRDVDRVERAIRAGGTRGQVFPSLSEIGTTLAGDGVEIQVRFVKKGGVPVRFIGAGEDVVAGAVREVDLQKKYHRSKADLAMTFKLDTGRCKALRWKFGIDSDLGCYHDFEFGSQIHRQYSDNAYTKLRAALDEGVDVEVVYGEYRAHNYGATPPDEVGTAKAS